MDDFAESLDVKGRVVPLAFTPTIETLAFYLGIHGAGGIVAPMPKDAAEEQLNAVYKRFEGCRLPDDAADILFTTGTTGRPKAVVWGHKTISANAENLVEGQGFQPRLNFIVCGPLNHIGSLSKIQATLMSGGTLWLLDGLRDINAFYDIMERCEGRVATFLVPASIRILLQMSRKRLAKFADKIDFIETGAAPISQADMQLLCETLPHSRLYNTYASTETGIVASYNFNDDRCEAGCVGPLLKNARLRVEGDGTLACGGASAMLGYADDEELTRATLQDGFVHTHDMGRMGADGMLRLTGRNDDIINVGGYKVNPVEVENAAMSVESVADCICVSVKHPITGNALKLWVVTKEGQPLDKRALAQTLRSKLEAYQVPLLYEQTPSIHRTFNGKLDRKWYQNKEGE
jgi:acyl-CoA synthetase (AMP-forming)/AMP-acid ligase II